jgi:hypothetical protein
MILMAKNLAHGLFKRCQEFRVSGLRVQGPWFLVVKITESCRVKRSANGL